MEKFGEKLFSQKGLYDGVKTVIDRELSDKEKKQINDKVRTEMEKFPSMKISALVSEEAWGLKIDVLHRPRPVKTKIDQINALIESEKKKIKRR